jgi:hypothetical protein
MDPLSPIPLPAPSRLNGLFGSARPKELAQLHACFVQLRLAVADRTTYQFGNLVVFVSFYIVEDEDGAVTRRKFADCIL